MNNNKLSSDLIQNVANFSNGRELSILKSLGAKEQKHGSLPINKISGIHRKNAFVNYEKNTENPYFTNTKFHKEKRFDKNFDFYREQRVFDEINSYDKNKLKPFKNMGDSVVDYRPTR